MEEKMKAGTINCVCGQQFYFESLAKTISCIKCNKVHDISLYPLKIDESLPEQPEEVDDADYEVIPEEPQNETEGE